MKFGMKTFSEGAKVILRSTFVTSKAKRGHAKLRHAKNHANGHFSEFYHKPKIAQWPLFLWTGWPQIRPPSTLEVTEAKNVIFHRYSTLFNLGPWNLGCARGMAILKLTSVTLEAKRGHKISIPQGEKNIPRFPRSLGNLKSWEYDSPISSDPFWGL